MRTLWLAMVLFGGCDDEFWLASARSELEFEWPDAADEVVVDVHLGAEPGEFPTRPVGNALRVSTDPEVDMSFPWHEDTLEVRSFGPGAATLFDVLGRCDNPDGCARTIPVLLSAEGYSGAMEIRGDVFVSSRRFERRLELGEMTMAFELRGE